ncbi:MAG: AbrB/MazE/SpoVT family DNA-binding domain-containing protein [Ramlibacter sp.]
MATATMTSKGQITVPRSVRLALGLHAGTKLDFVPTVDGFKVVPLRAEAPALKGRFAGRVAKPVSLEAMDEAIAAEASVRHVRGKR